MNERLFNAGEGLLLLGALLALVGLAGACSHTWGGPTILQVSGCSGSIVLAAVGVLVLVFAVLVFATGLWTSMRRASFSFPHLRHGGTSTSPRPVPSTSATGPRQTAAGSNRWTCPKCGMLNSGAVRPGPGVPRSCAHCGARSPGAVTVRRNGPPPHPATRGSSSSGPKGGVANRGPPPHASGVRPSAVAAASRPKPKGRPTPAADRATDETRSSSDP